MTFVPLSQKGCRIISTVLCSLMYILVIAEDCGL